MKRKYLKQLLVSIMAFTFTWANAQNVGDFTSVITGDWNNTSTWNTYDGAAWVAAGSTPTSSSVVYLGSNTTVTLTQDESVLDLHINNEEDVVRLSLGENTLSLSGVFSGYTGGPASGGSVAGGAPANTEPDGLTPQIYTVTNGVLGKIKIIGTANREVVADNTFNGNRRWAGMRIEFAFDAGFVGSFDESLRMGELTVASGVFAMDITGAADKLFIDMIGDKFTPSGSMTVKSGAKLILGSVITNSNDAPSQNLVVESGAVLELGSTVSAIAFVNLDISGTLAFNGPSGSTQSFPLSTSDGKTRPGVNELDSASIVTFEGNDMVNLLQDFYVSDSLIVNGATLFDNSTFDLNFASTGVLQFETAATKLSSSYYSASLYPNITVVNSIALELQNEVTIESGLKLNGLLFLGSNNLVMGENASDVLGTLSETAMVVTDGIGEFRKIFSEAGDFLFPLGDTIGVDDYSPVSLTLISGTGLSSTTYVGFTVDNNAHVATNDGSSLSRIWDISTNVVDLKYDLGATYTDSDITGDETKLTQYIFESLAGSSSSEAYGLVSPGSNMINLANITYANTFITATGRCSIADNDLTKPVDTSFCYEGTPAALVGSIPTTTTGNYNFVWEQSIDNGNYSVLTGETSKDYTEASLLSVGLYKFRRLVLDSLGCGSSVIDTSNVVEVIISDSVRINTISEANSGTEYCGALAANIVGSIPSGGSGTVGFTYAWDERFNGGVFTAVSGADQIDFSPADVTVSGTYEYRRVVTSGECPSGVSDTLTLVLNDTLKSGSVAEDQSIVVNTTPNTLTETISASGGGAIIAYQWMSSENKSSTFVNVDGAEGNTYSPGALSTTTYYLRKVISGECMSYTDTLTITVGSGVGLFEVNNSQNFEVYPNPTNNSLNIVIEGNVETVNISSATGGVTDVFEVKGTELDVSSLEKGVYIIEVITNNGNYISRFVKN